jgi:hypothetical protein
MLSQEPTTLAQDCSTILDEIKAMEEHILCNMNEDERESAARMAKALESDPEYINWATRWQTAFIHGVEISEDEELERFFKSCRNVCADAGER